MLDDVPAGDDDASATYITKSVTNHFCLQNDFYIIKSDVISKRQPGVNPIKLFLCKRTFFPFFAIKLGCFIVIALFYYVTK